MKKTVFLLCFITVILTIQAQNECETMLDAANKYYSEGKYDKAAKMFKEVQDNCGGSYGGAANKRKSCLAKINEQSLRNKELAHYKECTTVAACTYYLQTYPNGRYVSEVLRKRDELLEKMAFGYGSNPVGYDSRESEDAAYRRCVSEEACVNYLMNYPNGRYVSQVRAKMSEYVNERLRQTEDIAYARCTTEDACEEYMDTYPGGRYYAIVMAKRNEMASARIRKEKEAAKTAYMKIRQVEFGNSDKRGILLDNYGSPLFSSEIKYLKPRIVYDGIMDKSILIELNCRIIRPDGYVISLGNSSSNYSFSDSLWVEPGNNNTNELTALGNSDGGAYPPGNYRFELWFDGNMFFQTQFNVIEKENALTRGNWRLALRKSTVYPTQQYDNGSYKGELYNGNRAGLGMYYFDSESIYIGKWNSGEKSGMGIYSTVPGYVVKNCPNCVYYVGLWSSDEKTGTGACYDKLGNLVYFGTFANDKPLQYYSSNGNNSRKFECIEYYNGDYYLGETIDGKCSGRGLYIWSNGDIWYGNWENGERSGYGILMPYQGDVSTGTWRGEERQ